MVKGRLDTEVIAYLFVDGIDGQLLSPRFMLATVANVQGRWWLMVVMVLAVEG